MRLWRASTRVTFDGEGAMIYGARWNHPGTRVIYVAATLALALLEFVVHLADAEPPDRLVAHYVDVPEDLEIETLNDARLPGGWDESPSPPRLRDIGSGWAVRGSSLLLSVPTALLRVPRELIARERNYLMNPAHAQFGTLRAQQVITTFDPRLFR